MARSNLFFRAYYDCCRNFGAGTPPIYTLFAQLYEQGDYSLVSLVYLLSRHFILSLFWYLSAYES